jgi:adenylyltransferase/sulfurtransferase
MFTWSGRRNRRMADSDTSVIRVQEGRFARFEAIEWWNQARLARTRVLVVGAGALGNEVIKNLALLGIGHVAITDMDRIELSNLSRSVLFRAADEGRKKSECAARAAREIFPGMQAHALEGNILAELGLGWFRWADVVIGALDNREARVFVNSACARVCRPWIDGGIDVLHGIVRGFFPPATACYECTMGATDWELLDQRRSCSLLARRALAQRGTPTTPITASVIGAIQVQEVVKRLHGLPALFGDGLVFDGREHAGYRVNYQISPDCPWHEAPPAVESMPAFNSDTRLGEIRDEAVRRFGGCDALDLSREIVERLECITCGTRADIFQPAEKVHADQLLCPQCGQESAPVFLHSLGADSPHLQRTARELGLPAWDVVWARRGLEAVGLELTGDRPADVVDADSNLET